MGQASRIGKAAAEGLSAGSGGEAREKGGKKYCLAAVEGSSANFTASLHFRICEERDIPGIMEMDREAFFDPWSRNTWEREVQNPSALWLAVEFPPTVTEPGVAAAGVGVAGCAGVWLVAGEAQVMRVMVRRELRNRGIGRKLTGELVRRAWALGCDAVTLEVRESNLAAREVYRRCGFTESGIRPHYYADTQEGAVIMWLYRKKS